ncbi:MAG: sigma-70 family RNA polymerase sigma factor [Verrucomicrobia bacterium]|nr:sigma-70 family RNA polymerase sigma factor [Verrucomicrobiota bacterium]
MQPPPGQEDDTALVRAVQGGDADAFSELVRRYKSRVFGIASRFARGLHELEDLAQDIFLRAFRKIGAFRSEAPFEHWLSTVAVRRCYDHLRRTKHERTEESLEAIEFAAADDEPERRRAAREAHEVVHRALQRLPADMRLVLTLLELEDRSVREIASLTGWSEGNVKTRALRARARLKEILQAQRHE